MNIKISKEEYIELLEAKAFADDISNILEIKTSRSDTGLINHTDFGQGTLMLCRSYLEKRKKHKFKSEKP